MSTKRVVGWAALMAVLALGLRAQAAPAAPAAEPPRRVAVLPLLNLGVEEDVAESLVGFLRSETARLPGVALVEATRVARIVRADCRGEVRCLAQAGQKANADEVVFGTVAGVGEAYSIDLKRVEIKSAQEQSRITEMLSGESEQLIDGIRAAAYKLLLPEQYVGSVQVDAGEPGAEVYIDGKSVGRTPLPGPVTRLAPGKHAVKIVKSGYADFDRWVEVRFARTSIVKVDIRNNMITGEMLDQGEPAGAGSPLSATKPDPATVVVGPTPRYRVAGIATAGAGAAMLAAGALFGALNASNRSDIQSKQLPDGGVAAEDANEVRELLQSARSNAITANVLIVLGSVAMATGGGLVVYDLLSVRAQPVLVPARGGAAVGVVGEF